MTVLDSIYDQVTQAFQNRHCYFQNPEEAKKVGRCSSTSANHGVKLTAVVVLR